MRYSKRNKTNKATNRLRDSEVWDIPQSAMNNPKVELYSKLRDLVQGLAHATGCSAEERLLLVREEIRYTRQIARIAQAKQQREEATK